VPIAVLLVDDVEDVRRMVRVALRLRGGFQVVGEASSGADAVRLADVLRPDIVVLDLGLPDIAGREVLTRIRARSPGSRVVVFTGMEPADEGWITDQVEGYVAKHAELDYLLDLLEALGRPHATEATLDLPHELTSVATARRFVAQQVSEWKAEQILADAVLVTSELAANAIMHADSSCRIRLSLTTATLRIDVIDAGAGTPEPQLADLTAEHGRGLRMVAAVAAAWGMEALPGDGKLVWAELKRPAEDYRGHHG
jgi:CheY-like chemotaxis protein/anti-sigma regulatory factor (Ser/Thr protein kinase)